MPFAAWEQAFDPLLTPGARNYWKTHNFTELNDAVIDIVLEYANSLPSSQCEIFLALVGGQTSRIGADATAYEGWDANFIMNDHCISWARGFFDAATPYASGGAYINFMTDEEGDRVASAYGANLDRLSQIKNQ